MQAIQSEAAPVVNRLWVYYGPNEYTRHIDEQTMAAQYANFPTCRDNRPLKVTVVEHGGWSMSYYFDDEFPDGICVGTANDWWKPGPDNQRIMDRIYAAKENHLGSIRRFSGE